MTATPVTVAFVCVENAGRSQMAAAFANRELRRRDLDDAVTVVSGGTEPAGHVYETVIAAMADVGIDLKRATPRRITRDELLGADLVITMGCSADDVCPATWRGDVRDWSLPDPADQDLDGVREIRDAIAERVTALVDELAATTTA